MHRCIMHELLTRPAVSMRGDKELDSGTHSQCSFLNSLYRLKNRSRDFPADPSHRDVRAEFFRGPGSSLKSNLNTWSTISGDLKITYISCKPLISK